MNFKHILTFGLYVMDTFQTYLSSFGAAEDSKARNFLRQNDQGSPRKLADTNIFDSLFLDVDYTSSEAGLMKANIRDTLLNSEPSKLLGFIAGFTYGKNNGFNGVDQVFAQTASQYEVFDNNFKFGALKGWRETFHDFNNDINNKYPFVTKSPAGTFTNYRVDIDDDGNFILPTFAATQANSFNKDLDNGLKSLILKYLGDRIGSPEAKVVVEAINKVSAEYTDDFSNLSNRDIIVLSYQRLKLLNAVYSGIDVLVDDIFMTAQMNPKASLYWNANIGTLYKTCLLPSPSTCITSEQSRDLKNSRAIDNHLTNIDEVMQEVRSELKSIEDQIRNGNLDERTKENLLESFFNKYGSILDSLNDKIDLNTKTIEGLTDYLINRDIEENKVRDQLAQQEQMKINAANQAEQDRKRALVNLQIDNMRYDVAIEAMSTLGRFAGALGAIDKNFQHAAELFQFSTSIIGNLIGVYKNYENSLFNIQQGIGTLAQKDEMTNMALTVASMNYIAIGLTIATQLASSSKPSFEAEVFKFLNQLSEKLDIINNKLNGLGRSLNLLHKKIDGEIQVSQNIFENLLIIYSRLSYSISLVYRDNKLSLVKLDEVKRMIDHVDYIIVNQFGWTVKAFQEDIRSKIPDFETIFEYNTISDEKYQNAADAFYEHAMKKSASHTLANLDETVWATLVQSARKIITSGTDLSAVSFNGFFNYFFDKLIAARIIDTKPGLSYLGHYYVPSIDDFYLGVMLMAKLDATYPEKRNKNLRVDRVKIVSSYAQQFMSAIEDLTSNQFVNYLINDYQRLINNFALQYRTSLQEFANAKNKEYNDLGLVLGLPDTADSLWGTELQNHEDFMKHIYSKDMLYSDLKNIIDMLFGLDQPLNKIKSVENQANDQVVKADLAGLKIYFTKRCAQMKYLYDCLPARGEIYYASTKQIGIPDKLSILVPLSILVKENIFLLQAVAHGNVDPSKLSLQYDAFYRSDVNRDTVIKTPWANPAQYYKSKPVSYYVNSKYSILIEYIWQLCHIDLIVKFSYDGKLLSDQYLANAFSFTLKSGLSGNIFDNYNTFSLGAPFCPYLGKGQEGQNRNSWQLADDDDLTKQWRGYPYFSYPTVIKELHSNYPLPHVNNFVGDDGIAGFIASVVPDEQIIAKFKRDHTPPHWNSGLEQLIIPHKLYTDYKVPQSCIMDYCEDRPIIASSCSELYFCLAGYDIKDAPLYAFRSEVNKDINYQGLTLDSYALTNDLKLKELVLSRDLQAEFYQNAAEELVNLESSSTLSALGRDIDSTKLFISGMLKMVFPSAIIESSVLNSMLIQDGMPTSKTISDTFFIALGETLKNSFNDTAIAFKNSSLDFYTQNTQIPANNIMRRSILPIIIDALTNKKNILEQYLNNLVASRYHDFAILFTEYNFLNMAINYLRATKQCKAEQHSVFEQCQDNAGNFGYTVLNCIEKNNTYVAAGCDVSGTLPESVKIEANINKIRDKFIALFNAEPEHSLIDDIIRHIRWDDIGEFANRVFFTQPQMRARFDAISLKLLFRNITEQEFKFATRYISVDKYATLVPLDEQELDTPEKIEIFLQTRKNSLLNTISEAKTLATKAGVLEFCDEPEWINQVNFWLPRTQFNLLLQSIKNYYSSIALQNQSIDTKIRIISFLNKTKILTFQYFDQVLGAASIELEKGELIATDNLNVTKLSLFSFDNSYGPNSLDIKLNHPSYIQKINRGYAEVSKSCSLNFFVDSKAICYDYDDYGSIFRGAWQLIYFHRTHNYALYNVLYKNLININDGAITSVAWESCAATPDTAKVNLLPLYYVFTKPFNSTREYNYTAPDLSMNATNTPSFYPTMGRLSPVLKTLTPTSKPAKRTPSPKTQHTPKPHTPKPHTPKPHTPKPHTPKPQRTPKPVTFRPTTHTHKPVTAKPSKNPKRPTSKNHAG